MNKQCKTFFMEKMSLQEGKNEQIIHQMDENENFIISDIKSESLDEEFSTENAVKDIVPKLENLQLAHKFESSDSEQLAGHVRVVIPACGTVVVGLPPGGKILDVDTAIFAFTDEGTLQEIGFISDIFGSVYEPMYALQLGERAAGDTLKVDAEVFYLRDHPSTGYISVKREANNRYTVVRSTDIY